MIDRQQVNLRLERELVDSLDDLAQDAHVDRTEVARRHPDRRHRTSPDGARAPGLRRRTCQRLEGRARGRCVAVRDARRDPRGRHPVRARPRGSCGKPVAAGGSRRVAEASPAYGSDGAVARLTKTSPSCGSGFGRPRSGCSSSVSRHRRVARTSTSRTRTCFEPLAPRSLRPWGRTSSRTASRSWPGSGIVAAGSWTSPTYR